MSPFKTKVYEDISCEYVNGKWRCELYLEPMFREIPESEIELEIPGGGTRKVRVDEASEIAQHRKSDFVKVDGLAIYNCHSTNLQGLTLRIIPSVHAVMTAHIEESKYFGDRLHIECESLKEFVKVPE